jgi:hypothetical protein
VPEYFHFKENVTGYAPLKEAKKSSRTFNFRLGTQSVSRGGSAHAGQQGTAPQTINCTGTSFYYMGTNMPALREEPYMTTFHDYTSKIDLQIEGVQMPGRPYQSVMSSWEEIISDWMTRDTYGKQFDRNWMDEVIAPLQAKYQGEQLAVAIYEHVKNHMRHDNIIGIYPNAPIRKVYSEQKGSVAEINFLLTALLRKAGFTAVPVILSTRDNGRVHPVYPFLDKYNYMISTLLIDGKRYMLDATDKILAFGMLPVQALNSIGHEMLPGGQFVSIKPATGNVEFTMAKGHFDNNGKLVVDVTESRKNYGAYMWRSEIAEAGSEEGFKNNLKNRFEGWEVSNVELENVTDLYGDFSRKYHLESEEEVQGNSGNLYLNPILVGALQENIFKLENRKFPVDIPFPDQSTFMLSLTLPEGYKMTESPQPQQVTLPDNGGLFTYNVVQNGSIVQVICKLSLNQLSFSPEEYPNLRKFYEMVVAKHAESIVIQKQ